MSQRIAILAALPGELKMLTKGWQRQQTPKHLFLWTRTDADGDVLVAACAGMGAVAVRRAFQAAEEHGPLDMVLSVGLAGAADPGLPVGTVVMAQVVIDAQTGERFTLAERQDRLRLATVTRTAGEREKARLRATYGAALVDMEAATVARLAAMRSLRMGCLKAVSDTADAHLPKIDPFVSIDGQLSIPRFLLHLAVRPQRWAAVVQLAKNSRRASIALAKQLKLFLEHKDLEKMRGGDGS